MWLSCLVGSSLWPLNFEHLIYLHPLGPIDAFFERRRHLWAGFTLPLMDFQLFFVTENLITSDALGRAVSRFKVVSLNPISTFLQRISFEERT